MIEGLRTVIYKVADIHEAEDWYSRILEIAPYFSEHYYVGFQVGGFELGLDPDLTRGESPGGVVAYWGVDDAAAEYARLVGLGATPHEEARDVGGGIRVAAVRDPFGNVFGIIENPQFSRDAMR